MDRVLISIVSALFIITWIAVIFLFVQPDERAPLTAKVHHETQPIMIHTKDSTLFYALTEQQHDEVNTFQQMVNKRDGQGVSIDDLLDYFDLDDTDKAAPSS